MRTDRTRACAPCGLRFSTAACPRCKSIAAFDLGARGADEAAAEALRRAAARSSPRLARAHTLARVLDWLERGTQTVVIASSVLVGVVGLATLPSHMRYLSIKLFFLFFAATWALLSIAAAAARALLEMWRDRLLASSPITLGLAPDPPIDPSLKRAEVRGRVRVTEPISSPLGRLACAAFRLTGNGPSGAIDDAGGGTFELIIDGNGDGGGAVRVDARRASIALENFGKPATLAAPPRLAEFLRARGVLLTRGEVQVAEALLRNGDEVIVEGTCDEIPQALGYRETTTARLFKELDGSPLIIRRV